MHGSATARLAGNRLQLASLKVRTEKEKEEEWDRVSEWGGKKKKSWEDGQNGPL